MASNYSAYHPQNSQHPQYVYYAPALARHPNSPSYYYAPALPMHPVPAGQLHPRSRSFNDLYYPQHLAPGTPPPMALHAAPGGGLPSSAASVEHLNLGSTRLNSASSMHSIPAASSQAPPSTPATSQPANVPAKSPASPGSPAQPGSKPLRYRGRMARSKSHSSLLAPNAPLNLPMAAEAPDQHTSTLAPLPHTPPHAQAHAQAHAPAAHAPAHGRRLSSTSSLHRKNYSSSMSSTDGSSTPSIMSTADTDSLTTQTSVSSTSSVDDEAKAHKFNYARRRSVANSNTLAQNASTPEEDRGCENEPAPGADAAATTPADAAPVPIVTVNSDDSRESIDLGEEAAPAAPESGTSAQLPTEEAEMPVAAAPASTAHDEHALNGEAAEAAQSSASASAGDTAPPASVAAAAAASAAASAAVTVAASTAESPTSKAPISKIPIKQTQPQASEASQARQASVSSARSVKEHLREAAHDDVDPKDKDARLDDRALEIARQRPKRATMATPPKLVLPSDLQPRSYYQTTSGAESRNSLVAPRHARSASWYTGAVASPRHSEPRESLSSADAASQVVPRPRTPSAQSSSSTERPQTLTLADSSDSDSFVTKPRTPSAESDASSARSRTTSAQSDVSIASSPVFLRRSYASRQRPGVQSMPPRRPDSVLGSVQPNPRHPLPRQPSASSSLDQRRASAASVASAASIPAPAPARHATTATAAAPAPASTSASARAHASAPASAPAPAASNQASPLPAAVPKVRTSRSFGSRLKGMFSKEKSAEQPADDVSETASIVSTRSMKSSLSVRSSSSGLSSLSSRFRRKKGNAADTFEAPAPPAPAMTRRSAQESVAPVPPVSPLLQPTFRMQSATPSPTEPTAPRPPSPALSSIGRQVAPNLTAGDIYPGLLRPNEVDTIISSLERTGSFERKLSTSRRSKEEKVPDEQVIRAPEPVVRPGPTHKPLKSALRSGPSKAGRGRRIGFAQNTLVYSTYSAADYNRRPEPLPYNFRDRRVVTQLYRELNDVKLNMQVHPDSQHHTVYVFDPNERYLRALQS